MKLEYLAIVLALGVAAPAVGHLGRGFDLAIAGEVGAVAASALRADRLQEQREPTPAPPVDPAPLARQAGLTRAALAAWDAIPTEVRSEMRDVAAFKRFAAGSYPNLALRPDPGLEALIQSGLTERGMRALGRTYRPALERALAAIEQTKVEGELSLDAGGGARRLLRESAFSDEGAVLEQWSSAPTEAMVRRGMAVYLPDVPAAVRGHYVAWAKQQPKPKVSGGARGRIRAAGLEALVAGDFGAYMMGTRDMAGAVGARRGTPAFGIALDDLPGALRTWKSVPFAKRSGAVRRLMDGNLRIMRDGLAAAADDLAQHSAMWSERPSLTAQELGTRRRAIRTMEERVTQFEKRASASREEAFALVDHYLRTDERVYRAERHSGRVITPFREGIPSTDFMPLLSATDAHWGYDRVPAWQATGAYPMEVPIGAKEYDGSWGTPLGYTRHDNNHILDLHLNRRPKGMEEAGYAFIEERLAGLEGRDPALRRRIDRILGEAYWEPMSPLDAAGKLGPAYNDAVRTLATWVADWAAQNYAPSTERAATRLADARR
jgi:hypothetical protein